MIGRVAARYKHPYNDDCHQSYESLSILRERRLLMGIKRLHRAEPLMLDDNKCKGLYCTFTSIDDSVSSSSNFGRTGFSIPPLYRLHPSCAPRVWLSDFSISPPGHLMTRQVADIFGDQLAFRFRDLRFGFSQIEYQLACSYEISDFFADTERDHVLRRPHVLA